MSYSFGIRAASKAEAKEKVRDSFDRFAMQQKCHAHDRAQALAAANAFIDLLPDTPGRDITVSMSGSVGGSWADSDLAELTMASVTVSVALVIRP